MKKLIEKIYAFLSLASCTIIVCLYAYWTILESADIITGMQPSVVENANNTVNVGDLLRIKRYFCINNDNTDTAVLHRSFINHVIYTLPDIPNFKRGSGCQERVFAVEVPVVLPSGKYTYEAKIEYKLNPLRSVMFDLPSVEVNVVNPAWDKLQELQKLNK